MTPAEARRIDREEFEAECAAIRERAYRFVEQRRHEARAEIAHWLGRQAPAFRFVAPYTPKAKPQPKPKREHKHPQGAKHTFKGMSLTMHEWAAHLGISKIALYGRVHRMGSLEAAIAAGGPMPKGPQRKPINDNVSGRTTSLNDANANSNQYQQQTDQRENWGAPESEIPKGNETEEMQHQEVDANQFIAGSRDHHRDADEGVSSKDQIADQAHRMCQNTPSRHAVRSTSKQWIGQTLQCEPPIATPDRSSHYTICGTAQHQHPPGLSPNFRPSKGTGAGAVLQETPEIAFHDKAKS